MAPLPEIQKAKHANGLKWTDKALKRSLEREISVEDVLVALNCTNAAVVENEHNLANPSPACTVLGWDSRDRAIHAVVAYARMLIVTVYEPTLPKWATPWERAVLQ